MQKQVEQYIPSKYSQLANVYNRNEFDSIVKLLKNLAFHTLFNQKYPVLKLLKAVCRRLLINQFESIFFAYVVRTNRWNIHDHIIIKYCHEVRDVVCYSTEETEYKAVTMYLLLCGYTVKYYLNEDIEMYTQEMDKICPDFKAIFEQWAKQYAQTTLKINPKHLNKAFKDIYLMPQSPHIQADYNSLVDNLLQISPSYNPEKDKPKHAHTEAKTQPKQAAIIKRQQQFRSTNSSAHLLNPLVNMSLFTNSGFFQHINPMSASTNGSNLILKRKQLSLGSSIYGINHFGNLEDEQIARVEDVILGVGKVVQSDSEEQLQPKVRKEVKKEKNEDQQSLLMFNRVVSNTSDYIFKE